MSSLLRRYARLLALAICVFALGAIVGAPPTLAQNGANGEELWFRVLRMGGAPVTMQTSVVRYTGLYVADDGAQREVTVDLIGAVHIAEREYYDELNRIFQDYETVVYELVSDSDAVGDDVNDEKSKSKKLTIGANPLGWISVMQQLFGSALDLTYQMDGIDYGADNLRRGDCSPEELIAQAIANGDVFAFLMKAVVETLFTTNASDGDAMPLVLLCANDRQLAAKRLFALELEKSSLEELSRETKTLDEDEEYEEIEDDDALNLLEEDRESAIIHFRNDKALEVVEEELDAGRTKIAVFYGAAHLPDLGAKLELYYDLERSDEIRWLDAWDMSRANKE